MADALRPTPQAALSAPRHPWALPKLSELPKLTALTLASAIGGTGGTGGSGSTVFALLLAILSLAVLPACSAERSMEPSESVMPKGVATITCSGDVKELKLSCGGPMSASGQEILGGQGVEVALRSSDLHWNGTLGILTFKVSLQNLSSQKIGWTGTTPTAEKVFFVGGPFADVGTVNVDFATTGFIFVPDQLYYLYIGSLDPLQTSAPQQWQFHMDPSAHFFSFTVMVAADVFDQGGPLHWAPVTGTTQRWYKDVAASSTTDRMAVGNSGLTAHYTGGKWHPLPAVTQESINAVTAIGPGEYLAATGSGAVLQFKNGIWTEIYHRGDYGAFYAIWAKDTSQIVAVGQEGRVSQYYGGAWSNADVVTAVNADFVAVSGSADGTHVDAITSPFPVHDGEVWLSTNGGDFSLDPSFGPIVGLGLDIAFDGAGNSLLAYADFSGPPTGMIVSSTGDVLFGSGNFIPTALAPYGTGQVAVGFISDGAWAVLDLDYTSLPANPTYFSDTLRSGLDIARLTATNAGVTHFDIISGGTGHLLSWNGATWTDDQGSGDWMDPDLWGIGDTLFALDGIGGFYKVVNGVKTTLPSAGSVHRLWGISSTEFWAINSTDAWHYDPVHGWTDEYTVPGGSDNRDVWADPTGATVIVLGENGHIASRIGTTWSDQTIPRNVNAVWGCDSHNAWIVTQEGEIWKWIDGVVSFDIGAGPFPLRAISGTNFACDPWVAGDNGTMYHRLGGTWTNRWDPNAGSWTLRALAGRGAGQTYAAGDNGYAGLFSDASQMMQIPLPNQGAVIQSLWRLDNGEVYAAGSQFLLRGSR